MSYPAKTSSGYGRPLLKRDIEIAYAHANSAAEAARYLGVSYNTFRKYAKHYGTFRVNPSGKGVPRPRRRGANGILDILEGKYPTYDPTILLERCLRAGIFNKKCYLCGYNNERLDGRVPLLFHFRDGDRKNLKKDNLEPRCYNCMFITNGRVDKKILNFDPVIFQKDLIELHGGNDEGETNEFELMQEELLAEVEAERED